MEVVDKFKKLNRAQRAAACHGAGPLLILAGAGTGKTNTLAHRVAHLILEGANPQRILLLTFSRRAAIEMTRRAQRIVCRGRAPSIRLPIASSAAIARASGCSRISACSTAAMPRT